MRGTKDDAREWRAYARHIIKISTYRSIVIETTATQWNPFSFIYFFAANFFSSILIHTGATDEFRNRSYLRERLRIRWCLIRSIFIFFKLSRREQWNLRCDEFRILRIDTQIRTNNRINGCEFGRASNTFGSAPQQNSCFFPFFRSKQRILFSASATLFTSHPNQQSKKKTQKFEYMEILSLAGRCSERTHSTQVHTIGSVCIVAYFILPSCLPFLAVAPPALFVFWFPFVWLHRDAGEYFLHAICVYSETQTIVCKIQ